MNEVRETMIKILGTAAFLFCTAVAVPAMGQNFDEGSVAARVEDHATALQGWRPLVEQRDADAQSNPGVVYRYNRGVRQDYAQALSWYQLAAARGNARAQFNLGYMYEIGRGVTQDYAEAVSWYRLAAVQGNASAEYNLGVMYHDSRGVTQDLVTAHMWINISGANGHSRVSDGRGMVEEGMTREQIAEAQALARRCMLSDYQDCS